MLSDAMKEVLRAAINQAGAYASLADPAPLGHLLTSFNFYCDEVYMAVDKLSDEDKEIIFGHQHDQERRLPID